MITIAINTYNRANTLKQCLLSVINLEMPVKNIQLLIVDDNSTDQTSTICKEFMHVNKKVELNYVRLNQNINLGSAREIALENCKNKLIVFVDDDILLPKQWLVKLLATVKLYPDCALIGGPVIPVLEKGSGKLNWLSEKIIKGNAYSYLDYGNKNTMLAFPNQLITANCLLNLRILKKQAYFNPEFGPSKNRVIIGEDTELNWRVMQHHQKILYCPKLKVCHLIPKTKINKNYIRIKNLGWGLAEAKLYIKLGMWDRFYQTTKNKLRDLRFNFLMYLENIFKSKKDCFYYDVEIICNLGFLFEAFKYLILGKS
jgi:glucosyl-dolichyl phosphate glucuronosyltransferase